MVNNVTNFNNNKKKSDMAFLKEKMAEVGISQKNLALGLDKNIVTVNRWVISLSKQEKKLHFLPITSSMTKMDHLQ